MESRERGQRGARAQQRNAEKGLVLSKKMWDSQSKAQKEDPACYPLIQYTH